MVTTHLLPIMESFKKSPLTCYLFGKNSTMKLMQLQEIYDGWTGLNGITEREAAREMSIIGGQGMVKCNCRGKCNTKAFK